MIDVRHGRYRRYTPLHIDKEKLLIRKFKLLKFQNPTLLSIFWCQCASKNFLLNLLIS